MDSRRDKRLRTSFSFINELIFCVEFDRSLSDPGSPLFSVVLCYKRFCPYRTRPFSMDSESPL